LRQGAGKLLLNWDDSKQTTLHHQLIELSSELSELHVVKISLLREYAGRGYGFDPAEQQVDVVIQIKPYREPNWVNTGARLQTASTVISESITLAGLKHCNRLDSVLARAEFLPIDADEVLLATHDGYLVEGSMSNIFLHDGRNWVTPKLSRAGVNGIIRQSLLTQTATQETEILLSDVFRYDSAFVCNSLIGIVPVISVNSQSMQIHPDVSEFNFRLGFS
jgi:4-amino-4-deoxychorismate lyase